MPTEPKLRIGEPVPPFRLQDLQGNLVESSEFAGQDLLLFMWASW